MPMILIGFYHVTPIAMPRGLNQRSQLRSQSDKSFEKAVHLRLGSFGSKLFEACRG